MPAEKHGGREEKQTETANKLAVLKKGEKMYKVFQTAIVTL